MSVSQKILKELLLRVVSLVSSTGVLLDISRTQ